jgi:hypothetical protein
MDQVLMDKLLAFLPPALSEAVLCVWLLCFATPFLCRHNGVHKHTESLMEQVLMTQNQQHLFCVAV